MTKEERDELTEQADRFDRLTEFADKAGKLGALLAGDESEWRVWELSITTNLYADSRNGINASFQAGGHHKGREAVQPILDRLQRGIGQALRVAADEADDAAKKL